MSLLKFLRQGRAHSDSSLDGGSTEVRLAVLPSGGRLVGVQLHCRRKEQSIRHQFMKRTETEQRNILIGRLRSAETKYSFVSFQSQFSQLKRQASIAEHDFCCVANLIHETKRHTRSVSRLSWVAAQTQLPVRRFPPAI